MDLERPIALKNEPSCVETYTAGNLNWNNEIEPCLVTVEESATDIDVDVVPDGPSVESGVITDDLDDDIDSEGPVIVDDGVEVDGHVDAGGDVTVGEGGEIEGDVDASGIHLEEGAEGRRGATAGDGTGTLTLHDESQVEGTIEGIVEYWSTASGSSSVAFP